MIQPPSMLTAALRLFGRLGLLSALLLALAAAAVSAPAQAFAPDQTVAAEAVADTSTPCDIDSCFDCGPACGHGCCHGSLVAVAETPAALQAPIAFAAPQAWTQRTAAPLAAPSGPDRPPRS
jgi:hypothetical protein